MLSTARLQGRSVCYTTRRSRRRICTPRSSAPEPDRFDARRIKCTRRRFLWSTLLGTAVVLSRNVTSLKPAIAEEAEVPPNGEEIQERHVAEPQVEAISIETNTDPSTVEVIPVETDTDLSTAESKSVETDTDLSTVEETKKSIELSKEEVDRLMQQEKERRKQNGRRGRLRELEETRNELAQMQMELLQKEKELMVSDQSLTVLREELELERKIRALLTKEKEQALEEAALAMGLCGGGTRLMP